MRKLTVVFERDEERIWQVWVAELKGCRSYGRSMEEARSNIREALETCDVDPDKVKLLEDLRLPADAKKALRVAEAARKRAVTEQARAKDATAAAVTRLVRGMGLGVRDAAELLGLSYQRVHQLVKASEGRLEAAGGGQ